MNETCLYDRSKDEGLVSVEWITNPSVVFDNCLSVVCLSRAKVDASSSGFFTADFDGHLQHRTCLPVDIHVCGGNFLISVRCYVSNIHCSGWGIRLEIDRSLVRFVAIILFHVATLGMLLTHFLYSITCHQALQIWYLVMLRGWEGHHRWKAVGL